MFKFCVSIVAICGNLNKPTRIIFHDGNQMRSVSLTLDRSRWIISTTTAGAQLSTDSHTCRVTSVTKLKSDEWFREIDKNFKYFLGTRTGSHGFWCWLSLSFAHSCFSRSWLWTSTRIQSWFTAPTLQRKWQTSHFRLWRIAQHCDHQSNFSIRVF